MTRDEILNELMFDTSNEREHLIAKIAMAKYAKEKCIEQKYIIAGIQNPKLTNERDDEGRKRFERVMNIREPNFD